MRYLKNSTAFGALTVLATILLTPHQGLFAQSFSQLERDYEKHLERGEYEKAIDVAEKALEKAKRVNDHEALIYGHYYLGAGLYYAGRHNEAEPHYLKALEIAGRIGYGNSEEAAELMTELAEVYIELGRYAEGKSMIRRSLKILERRGNLRGLAAAYNYYALGYLYTEQGYYGHGETMLRTALETAERIDKDNVELAWVHDAFAALYIYQGHFEQAEPHVKRSLVLRKKHFTEDNVELVESYYTQAWLHAERDEFAAAEPIFKKCLQTWEEKLGPDHRATIELRYDFAEMYRAWSKMDVAEPMFKQCLESVKRYIESGDHPQAVWVYNSLAKLCMAQNRFDEAKEWTDRAVLLAGQGAASAQRYVTHLTRAEIVWKNRGKATAIAELREAMRMAEEQRGAAGGAEHARAKYFVRFSEAYERMVEWQTELGDVSAAFEAMERSRTRSLLDQLTIDGNLYRGVDKDIIDAEKKASELVSKLESDLRSAQDNRDLSDADRKSLIDKTTSDLRIARQKYVAAYAAVRNASPAYQFAMGQDNKPIDMDEMQDLVEDREGVFLEYLIGDKAGYVLIITADGDSRLIELTVDNENATELDVEPGPLNAGKLQRIFNGKNGKGPLSMIRDNKNKDEDRSAAKALHVLWKILIPSEQRKAILDEKVKRLLISPHGSLNLLPFEVLVIDPSASQVEYLLDVGPPIHYAPSATVHARLSGRKINANLHNRVLTIGDPNYSTRTSTRRSAYKALSTKSRYSVLGGTLNRLPFTSWESRWIKELFTKSGVEVTSLTKSEATEANVRRSLEGQRIVHFACHGLADQRNGNLFGSLALTPGRGGASDDGFLSLAEIYGLDLTGCDLAILSACDTNFGPEQAGEGVIALSRGFLVAGSNRVLASNWIVDDKAGAHVVYYFCREVTNAEQNGDQGDYAGALHFAKKKVRNNSDWHHPYYWACHVLLGPN